MKKRMQILFWVPVLWCLLSLCACRQEEPVFIPEEAPAQTVEEEETAAEEPQKEEEPEVVYVFVCGAVNQEGVYQLPLGSRVYEAIASAGGLTEDAAVSYVNQAQLLTDGMQITVPSQEEAAQMQVSGSQEAAGPSQGKVDLNRATAEELQELSGIGAVKAAAIIAYREEQGGFSSIEEIQEVDGISQKTFEKIKEQITVGG